MTFVGECVVMVPDPGKPIVQINLRSEFADLVKVRLGIPMSPEDADRLAIELQAAAQAAKSQSTHMPQRMPLGGQSRG